MEKTSLRRTDDRPTFLHALLLDGHQCRTAAVRKVINVAVNLVVYNPRRQWTTVGRAPYPGMTFSASLTTLIPTKAASRCGMGPCVAHKDGQRRASWYLETQYVNEVAARVMRSRRTWTCRRLRARNSLVERYADPGPK